MKLEFYVNQSWWRMSPRAPTSGRTHALSQQREDWMGSDVLSSYIFVLGHLLISATQSGGGSPPPHLICGNFLIDRILRVREED